MNKQQLQDELNLLIVRTSLQGKYAIVAVAEAHNITFIQAMALCLLDPQRPVPMNTLSTFLGSDPSNVTGIVERLVVESFIDRKESTTDRRIKMIVLTQRGLDLRSELLNVANKMRFPRLSQLSQSELEQAIQLLGKAADMS